MMNLEGLGGAAALRNEFEAVELGRRADETDEMFEHARLLTGAYRHPTSFAASALTLRYVFHFPPGIPLPFYARAAFEAVVGASRRRPAG